MQKTPLLLLFLCVALTGCASRIEPAPVVQYRCAIPLPMTDAVALPPPPSGKYTQKDVAAYIETEVVPALSRCNARLGDIRAFTNQ
jgi:hypothetical protein